MYSWGKTVSMHDSSTGRDFKVLKRDKLEVNHLYVIEHRRKGTFIVRIVSVDGCQATASLIGPDMVEKGETLSFCTSDAVWEEVITEGKMEKVPHKTAGEHQAGIGI